MNRWCGKIGFAEQVESAPSVWTEEITERIYRGDVLRNTRRLQDLQQINNNISISNQISIVGDAYIRDHFVIISYGLVETTPCLRVDFSVFAHPNLKSTSHKNRLLFLFVFAC